MLVRKDEKKTDFKLLQSDKSFLIKNDYAEAPKGM